MILRFLRNGSAGGCEHRSSGLSYWQGDKLLVIVRIEKVWIRSECNAITFGAYPRLLHYYNAREFFAALQ